VTCKLERQGKKGVLYLSGNLTVGELKEVKDAILKALQNTDELMLNINDIESIDVAFLQMICSAHQSSQGMKKVITLSGEIDNAYRHFVGEAGFSRESGCRIKKAGKCFFSL